MSEQTLARGDAAVAVAHVEAALNPPGSLGETRQPLASPARLSPAMGIASILAARRLGESEYADELVTGLARHAEQFARTPAVIDYFATSLPSLILFDEDPHRRLVLAVQLLGAQLALLASDPVAARHQLDFVLVADPGHELARDIINQLEAAGSPR